jgi:hypothetical protein
MPSAPGCPSAFVTGLPAPSGLRHHLYPPLREHRSGHDVASSRDVSSEAIRSGRWGNRASQKGNQALNRAEAFSLTSCGGPNRPSRACSASCHPVNATDDFTGSWEVHAAGLPLTLRRYGPSGQWLADRFVADAAPQQRGAELAVISLGVRRPCRRSHR